MLFTMSNKIFFTAFLVSSLWLCGCTKAQTTETTNQNSEKPKPQKIGKIKNQAKIIHVLVALCDNENQGIVPVPAHLGDGENPNKNLYWGAAYGVKAYFSKSNDWEKISSTENPKENVLERMVFKRKNKDIYLIAEAYRGSKMKETIDDFFGAVSGNDLENVSVNGKTFQISGSADLIAFVGHNGLMDFKLENQPSKTDEEKRDAVILACASRNYFSKPLKKTGANPVLWTSNLMAPEAYILHDALEGWIGGETNEQIQTRAANAYAKYQKISLKSAKNLLVTGW